MTDEHPRRPTIYDIAETAGVSHMTVSRYLRFDGERTRKETRAEIKAAIEELDYRPNLAARAMRTNRTGRLAILFPFGTAISSVHMLAGATEAARDAGYQVDAITLAGSAEERSARMLELAEAGLFEGLLALTNLASDRQEQIASRVPVVVGAEYDDEMRGIGDLADASPFAEIIETSRSRATAPSCTSPATGHTPPSAAASRPTSTPSDRLGLESAGIVGGRLARRNRSPRRPRSTRRHARHRHHRRQRRTRRSRNPRRHRTRVASARRHQRGRVGQRPCRRMALPDADNRRCRL